MITKAFIEDFIKENEIELSSTHSRLCLPVIIRIYKKMAAGIRFPGIKVENKLICDGHHRYVASLLCNFSLDRIPAQSTSATTLVHWESVLFEEEDWDTPAKIRMLTEKDAEFNNITIDEIFALLK